MGCSRCGRRKIEALSTGHEHTGAPRWESCRGTKLRLPRAYPVKYVTTATMMAQAAASGGKNVKRLK